MRRPYTIKPTLQKDKPNKRGECPLVLVIHLSGLKRKVPLLRYLHPEDWNTASGSPLRTAPGYTALSRFIINTEEKARAVIEDHLDRQITDIDIVLKAVRLVVLPEQTQVDGQSLTKRGPELHKYMDKLLADEVFCSQWKGSTLKAHRSKANILHTYMPRPLYMNELTPLRLTELGDALKQGRPIKTAGGKLRKHKGQSPQTVNNTFKILNAVYKWAKKRGVVKTNPFDEWEKEQVAKAHRVRESTPLTLQQCDAIKKVAMGEDELIAGTAAFFLLECYSGLRQSDWGKWFVEEAVDKKKYLRIPRTTKNGEPIRMLLDNSPRLRWVVAQIQDRFMGYNYSQGYVNRLLKRVAELAGIPYPLSSHYGRHTAATNLYDLWRDTAAVADALGITEKVVLGYIKVLRSHANRAFEEKGGL